jgi:death-on-curing protein
VNEPLWLLDEAVLIAHEISLAQFGGSDGIRDAALLESALARPKNLFAYSKPTFMQLAAAYTYGIVRNHPFVDGNKRTGFLAGAAFLELSGLNLRATETDATSIIVGVAAGGVTEEQLAQWYERNVTR